MGLVHLVAGAAESMTPVYLHAFVTHAVNPPSATIREAFFFWSAIVGFIIGLLLLVLLALSNNWSMTLIGQRWWKRLHRLSYIVFTLTILHGLGFQVLESRWWVGYGLVGALALAVYIAQIRGIQAIARRRSGR
jgi:DMSO/TMAO reductase YedYZ heme-binding membrane subunit